MSFYSMYRIFKDIFKTIFGYKFWRKLLIIILIGVLVFFVLHNYGYCVEPDASYNQVERIGTLQQVGLNNSGTFTSYPNTNTVTEIYKIEIGMTYSIFTATSTGSYFKIAVGDSNGTVGDTVTIIENVQGAPDTTMEYQYYNNGYNFLYVTYNNNGSRSFTLYQQVYSTYIKPLVTPTHAVFSVSDSQVLNVGGTDTYYFNAFQINKGFNYKVSGISSDLNFYYTSELNQIDAAGYEWYYYQTNSTTSTKEFYPIYNVSVNHYNTNDWYSGTLIPGSTTVNYNEITTYNNQAYYNQTNQNILPFYDTISNNEEFTAAYTGWLLFMTTSDLSESLEIWTDYNFYDHDTIYIDNRIQNVNSSVQQGTSEINQSVQNMENTISDNLTNTNYNQSDVNFNTSSVDNVSSSATDGIFTTIFNNFNNAVSGGVSELVIPLPHNSGSITITSDIVSRHLGNLTLLVNAFWMYLFGIYAFRFVNNLIHSIKNGDILNGFNSSNEVITNTMV